MRLLVTALFAGFLVLSAPAQTVLYPGMEGEALLASIRTDYAPDQTRGYNLAREELYGYTQDADGEVCAVYSGFCVVVPAGQNPRTFLFTQHRINTEHTWPQSFGAGDEPERSDMHNLFPTREQVNSDRGNDPFGEIPDAQTQRWYRGSVERQSTIPTTDIDEWSEDTGSRFEPREDHKGNAARAVFYFYAIYPDAISSSGDAFFAGMLGDLLEWNESVDPADDRERARSTFIATRQGTENPFVLDPTLARRAFSPGTVAAEEAPTGLTLSVFPNPTTGRVVVETTTARRVRIDILDGLGRRVQTVEAASASARQTVDLSGVPSGLYLVRVTADGAVASHQVVVVRR